MTVSIPGKRHPLYRAIKIAWWVVAIWLSAAVLIGVIRGAFVTGPVPREGERAPTLDEVRGAPAAPKPLSGE